MQTTVHWLENVAFEAKTQSGHSVIMDGSPEYGGENRGPRPMELILTGLGGCASFDIVTILKKSFDQLLIKQATHFSIYSCDELCPSLRNQNKSVKHEKGRSLDQPQMT